jgi:type IV secretory pathway VirB4 component
MSDLPWLAGKYFTFPLFALNTHAVILGSSGSGKTITIQRVAYGAHKVHQLQVVYLDAKGPRDAQ